MEHEDSLSCSKQPATGPYPEPDESRSHLPHSIDFQTKNERWC